MAHWTAHWTSAQTSLIASWVQVGFPRRDEAKLKIALDKTHTTLWIRATKTTRWAQKNQLLGFARATSDANLTATIWDVAVHPAWQRQGAGRGLVERLVASLCAQGVPLICLYAEPNVVLLYEKLGFQKDVKRIKGMGFATKSAAGQQVIAAAVQLQ
jgi:aralkylamine N-acetyltransferase